MSLTRPEEGYALKSFREKTKQKFIRQVFDYAETVSHEVCEHRDSGGKDFYDVHGFYPPVTDSRTRELSGMNSVGEFAGCDRGRHQEGTTLMGQLLLGQSGVGSPAGKPMPRLL